MQGVIFKGKKKKKGNAHGIRPILKQRQKTIRIISHNYDIPISEKSIDSRQMQGEKQGLGLLPRA